MVLEICLGIPFMVLMWKGYQIAAVAIEWIMAVLISVYLWSLIGILGYDLSLRFREQPRLTSRFDRPIRSGQIKLSEDSSEQRQLEHAD